MKKTETNTLGPLTDLESHVKPEWWRHIFNSLYLKTDGDVVSNQEITQNEVDLFLQALSITPDQHILDVCCGQGRHTLELFKRGYTNIEGIDSSSYLIQEARRHAKEENFSIKFTEADVRSFPYPDNTFQVVMILGNSFGYFENTQDDLHVLKQIFRAMKDGGKLLLDIVDGNYIRDNFQTHSWEWIDKKMFVCREREISLDKQRLISREIITDADKGVIADQFYAERLYSQENIIKLIESAGFQECTFHGELSLNPLEHPDLGMMAKRLILSAIVDKKQVPLEPKLCVTTASKNAIRSTIKNVAVILADPSKTDSVLPGSSFNTNEFYEIDQLKIALSTLQDTYQFTYFNDHNTLFHDLAKIKSKFDFVFNLCDAGLDNQAHWELHIPTLLEAQRIPYTGAGPQCLAKCYDKSLVRGVAKKIGIPVAKACLVMPNEEMTTIPLSFPVIVKPNEGDGSWAITKENVVFTHEKIADIISTIQGVIGNKMPILIEEFLEGNEITVGIIGNISLDPLILPLLEEDYSDLPPHLPKICGYEAKWEFATSPYGLLKSIEASISEETKKAIIDGSLQLFQRLKCQDYARFDWRLDKNGSPKLLEINPNPGWVWDGHLAKMCKLGGISYAEMLRKILQAAEQRLEINSLIAK